MEFTTMTVMCTFQFKEHGAGEIISMIRVKS